MNLFKKLFKAKEETKNTSNVAYNEINTTDYFNKRYTEDRLDNSIIEGTLHMLNGYYKVSKVTPLVKDPINHPLNLDQTISEGFDFLMYCKTLNEGSYFAVGILAMAFNIFIIKNYGFKLYKDSEPEFPLRTVTLKYDNKGAVLSLYPMEYATKVLKHEATFKSLYERLQANLSSMPTGEQAIDEMLNNLKTNPEE